MDDLSGRIQSILSDEESLRQLQELAQMLSGGTPVSSTPDGQGASAEPQDCSTGGENQSSGLFGEGGLDIGLLMQLSGLFSASANDNGTQLLLALRPLISEERRMRLDKAAKILRLLAVYTAAKESGLLSGLENLI